MARKAGAYIDIELTGDASYVHRMLDHLDNKLGPQGLTAFLSMTVFPYLMDRAKQRFQDEGDDVVGKWAPLAPATEVIRQSMGYGGAHPINVRTGELERYITQGSPSASVQASPLGAFLQHPASAPSGKLKSKVKTAQQGDPKFGRNGTPPRPVLGMNEVDLGYVMTALAFFVGQP
jgi:hypothetical protein